MSPRSHAQQKISKSRKIRSVPILKQVFLKNSIYLLNLLLFKAVIYGARRFFFPEARSKFLLRTCLLPRNYGDSVCALESAYVLFRKFGLLLAHFVVGGINRVPP